MLLSVPHFCGPRHSYSNRTFRNLSQLDLPSRAPPLREGSAPLLFPAHITISNLVMLAKHEHPRGRVETSREYIAHKCRFREFSRNLLARQIIYHFSREIRIRNHAAGISGDGLAPSTFFNPLDLRPEYRCGPVCFWNLFLYLLGSRSRRLRDWLINFSGAYTISCSLPCLSQDLPAQ